MSCTVGGLRAASCNLYSHWQERKREQAEERKGAEKSEEEDTNLSFWL